MRVMLVITGLSMGGAERVVTELADALSSNGCDVLLVYLTGPLQVRPRRSEVAITGLGIDGPGDIVAGYFRLRRAVREFRPDIVHSHMFHATMLTRLLRLSMPVPRMISTMHTGHPGNRHLRTVAYRLTDPLTDISTNVSCEAVDAFVASHAVRPGRMIAIHNGIAVEVFRASSVTRDRIRRSFAVGPDCKLLLAVGRLNRSKDYPNLFDALTRLPADLDFKLLIAGDGPLRTQLEQRVGDLDLSSRVNFLGIREDVPALMSAADVFVLSSVWESFGLVVAEAMACERIVVATDSGGVREVLGNAGFLVPARDPSALANAVMTACLLPDGDAMELGQRARRRVVDTYSFERAIEKWRELYASLMAAPVQLPGNARG